MDVVQLVDALGSKSGKPAAKAFIRACGQL
jgi:hypothetical protein